MITPDEYLEKLKQAKLNLQKALGMIAYLEKQMNAVVEEGFDRDDKKESCL